MKIIIEDIELRPDVFSGNDNGRSCSSFSNQVNIPNGCGTANGSGLGYGSGIVVRNIPIHGLFYTEYSIE